MTSPSLTLSMTTRGGMSRTQCFLLLILAQVAIGVGPLMVRQVDVGPADSAFWRLSLSLLAWVGIALFLPRGKVGLKPGVKAASLLLGAGIAFAADLTTYHFALMHTAIANATFLANLSPLLVALGAWALFGEKPARRALLALAVALMGAAIMTGFPHKAGMIAWGDGLALIACLFYTLYLLLTRRLAGAVSDWTVILWTSFGSVAAALVLAAFRGGVTFPHSAGGWAAVLGLGLISQTMGQGLTLITLARLPAASGSLMLLAGPVVAMLSGWAVYGETPGLDQALGGAVILAALVLARRG
ncbi:DMT family transporter [Elstera cyanobacteriorum]|uniref:DMT family transporter n=1 Tax=Elstera cyanobacteriorum TaxID=2022747 RepID=UPI00235533D1|nr:DMT family transporter [Elstera cyanobacteriorum]MCK6441582.1 DMT family transporter [Elstera cyanobacteriorum]